MAQVDDREESPQELSRDVVEAHCVGPIEESEGVHPVNASPPRSSPAKRSANLRNAARSTGPRTQAGKAISSANARKHGLLSRRALLSDESASEFAAFRSRLLAALRPDGELEVVAADRVVTGAWRLRRLVRVEGEMLERGRYQWDEKEDLGVGTAFISLSVNGDVFSKLSRYETSLERGFFRSLHELQRLQSVRRGERVVAPLSVELDVTGVGGEES